MTRARAMPDRTPHEAPYAAEPAEVSTGDIVYEAPEELADEDGGGRPRSSAALKIAALAAVVLAGGGGLLAYRAHHHSSVVAAALSQADAMLRLDTAAGYREAATRLEPIAKLDPVQGASVRAFALAMLFADYREARAEAEIENLLVAPGRAEVVPAYAQLATAALALGRKEAGTAAGAVARAGDGPWPRAMEARVALLAGNVEAALSPAAAAAEAAFPPGLALHGDALRRLQKDAPAARAAYEAALAASPAQPRAAYGLAKLALAGHAPPDEAEAALKRLVEDRDATPAPERGRAALHLAALRLRSSDRRGAEAALDSAGLKGAARAWAERAAAVASEQRGPYRAVAGAPEGLQSASDDDPGDLSPNPPPPPPPPPASKAAVKRGASKKAALAKKGHAVKSGPAAKKAGAAKWRTGKKAAKKTARTR